jgi:hypothetical protein
MAMQYIRLSSFGSIVDLSHEDEVVEVVAVLHMMSKKRRWGGSIPERKTYKRDHFGADKRLMADYFAPRPLYNADHFRRRFMFFVLLCVV